MNLANKLTRFRIFLIPIIVFLLIGDFSLSFQTRRYFALIIFVVASLTDALDGFIARRFNMQTNFGKLMDPLADKILVISTLIAIKQMPDLVVSFSSWVIILIVSRELFITGVRLIAVEQNIVIAAGVLGKIKTIFQMFMVIFLLINFNNLLFKFITYITIYGSIIFTVLSAIEYTFKNKQVFFQTK